MGFDRALPLALGALAVSSGLALLTFDIIFSLSLSRSSPQGGAKVVAIVASGLESVTASLLLLLLGRQIRYRNGAHIQDFGHGRQHTYLLAGFGGVFAILAAVTSAVMLGMVKSKTDLPRRIAGSSARQLVTGGFIAWAIVLLSQATFVACMIVIQRRDFQQQIQPYRTELDVRRDGEVQESERPQASSIRQGVAYPEKTSMDSKTPPSSSGRSRAGSDAMTSIRSSFSQVMRPTSSKTKLINSRSPYRNASIESHHEICTSVDDGFDSWDTSTVDAQSRHAVESASPTPPRFLETIPASPTGSRSPSPGFPLDLEPPPKTRTRSRSYSPANSFKDLPRTARTTSPESPSHEAHIHPLFRTDSPTPPPAATPGTVVTAAPGAGQVISDRQSIRSMSRMRSGSLPSSPLVHSASLDSIKFAIEHEERERLELGGERTLTPPIPDFVLNGGPRNSLTGYTKRKASGGLGKVGEGSEV
jgi:hypothetical protein